MPRWTHGPMVQLWRAVGVPDGSAGCAVCISDAYAGRAVGTPHGAADVCAFEEPQRVHDWWKGGVELVPSAVEGTPP